MQKIKKTGFFLTIFACIFALAGVAFAANRVEVKVTSEPIPQGSACSKAGGFSLEFDEGSVLEAGDIITIDTAFGTTLCRSFDIMISPANDVTLDANGNYLSGTLWDNNITPDDDSAAFDQTAITGDLPAGGPFISTISTAAAGGVVFRVVGISGTQRITVYVLGPVDAAITVNNAVAGEDDVVSLKFLDESTNDALATNPPVKLGPSQWDTPSVWEDSTDNSTTVNLVYDDSADWEDNTLCVNVSSSNFAGTTVNGNMDAKNDKFTFIPTNPQIAHIANAVNYSLFDCKGAKVDNIPLPEEGQTSTSCAPFDYEDGTGYCAAVGKTTVVNPGRRIVIQRSSAFSATDTFGVKLQIVAPAEVYWGGSSIGYTTMKTATCSTGTPLALTSKATDSAGNEVTTFASGNTCTVTSSEDAKTLISAGTTSGNITFSSSDQTAIFVDLPTLVYSSGVETGDVVQVKVTLTKEPCGDVFSTTVDLGTFGCENTSEDALLYPYFTSMTDGADAFWDGFVINNLGGAGQTATIMVYEADGDQGKQTVTVEPFKQYVNVLSAMVDGFSMTNTGGSGKLGDSSCYIKVTTDFNADGFAMMGTGSEAQGYLPRDIVESAASESF